MPDDPVIEEKQTTIEPDERRAAERLKERDDVQRALRETGGAPETAIPSPAPKDQVRLWSYLIVLVGLAAFYYLLRLNTLSFTARALPLVSRAVLGAMAVVLLLGANRAVHAFLIKPMDDAVARYNLSRVTRLVVGLGLALIAISVLFANWYAAVVSLGILSLVLGLALQTPITSFIGWIYILIKQPYRVGDRVRIGDAKGDVIDVSYLDTTLWEFGGEYLSTDHPSGRIIKFPNSVVLKEAVYNYSWPLFPYIWNEIKVHVAYNSDFEFIAKTMREVAEEELGQVMLERVRVFRALLEQTPVDELQVREQPSVFFRPMENSWIEAIVRYVVPPREAGRIKNRMIVKILERLNAEPDRVKFPKDNLR
ncbi:MAG TPA: mechanosensitive ion channel family protein [bacterium]|jgi:small-conductance mechanosensitive channel|nr:mechanosensitive ion channel family protein [bacterium]